jgi:benzoylsuccinyl-CoA thiolase BbsB subunit
MTTSTQVWVAGVGMTDFGFRTDATLAGLGQQAVVEALADSGIDRLTVNEVFSGNAFGGSLVGQRVSGPLGLSGLPVTNVSNACASGASAIREAFVAITSGRVDTALVVGVEHLTSLGRGPLPLDDADIEVMSGMQMPVLYAMRAQRYLDRTGATVRDLAAVAVKARKAAMNNPHAHYRAEASVEEVLESRPIASPLTRLMCCPNSDGAAALVLTRHRPSGRPAVSLDASVLSSGRYTRGPRDLDHSDLAERTVGQAYEAAGLGPQDIDIAEVHDAFAIAELIYYEALGFCRPGEGAALLASGATAPGGRIPVNVGGGLLCRGHPVGATGVAQVCEVVRQLRGDAGSMQLDGLRTALTHVTGGGISGYDHAACGVQILSAH